MNTAGAFALGLSEVAFYTPPPNRPSRSERSHTQRGRLATLLRTIRRELAHAAEAPVTDWMPRVTHYPY